MEMEVKGSTEHGTRNRKQKGKGWKGKARRQDKAQRQGHLVDAVRPTKRPACALGRTTLVQWPHKSAHAAHRTWLLRRCAIVAPEVKC